MIVLGLARARFGQGSGRLLIVGDVFEGGFGGLGGGVGGGIVKVGVDLEGGFGGGCGSHVTACVRIVVISGRGRERALLGVFSRALDLWIEHVPDAVVLKVYVNFVPRDGEKMVQSC